MLAKTNWKLYWAFIVIYAMMPTGFAETIKNPCAGPSALINIINRPTVADSACVVPFKHSVVEFGYQYQKLRHPSGDQQNYPQAEFRLGLPANNEFVILLPNYIHQSIPPRSGFSAATMGVKHELGYSKHWLASVESLFTLPSGSGAFGSKGLGVALNGILSYNLNKKFNLTFMLGVTTETAPRLSGGQRFMNMNPDLVLTYSANQKFDIFGEIYGESQTGPGEGSGFNFDAGIIYLLRPSVAIDFEIAQRISGSLGNFSHYIGAGMSIMF